MTASRPALSVVVPTRDRPDALRQCLSSLSADVGPDDEVIVVDSASTGLGPRQVAAEAGVRVIVADRPGASLARNLGWRAARHDLIAFVDDDVEVLDGWAAAMAAALSRPGASFVTGWIGVAPHQLHLPEPNPVMLLPDARVLDSSTPGSFGASANCGFHRESLEAMNGFSERFGPGTWISAAEDQELFDRLVASGRLGYYEPLARVYHDQWRSRSDALRLHWRYGKGMGGRLAQLRRLDRRRCRRTAREVLWDDCLVGFGRALRAGYQTGAVFAVLRLTGTAVGFLARVLRP